MKSALRLFLSVAVISSLASRGAIDPVRCPDSLRDALLSQPDRREASMGKTDAELLTIAKRMGDAQLFDWAGNHLSVLILRVGDQLSLQETGTPDLHFSYQARASHLIATYLIQRAGFDLKPLADIPPPLAVWKLPQPMRRPIYERFLADLAEEPGLLAASEMAWFSCDAAGFRDCMTLDGIQTRHVIPIDPAKRDAWFHAVLIDWGPDPASADLFPPS